MTLVRSDAAFRRRQLLDAADEVFSAHGVHAPLELVIERSGYGRATLYRHFADRTALMSALLERSMDGMERLALDLAEHVDGLAILLRDVAEHVAHSAALVDFWRAMERDHPVIAAADQRCLAILMPLVRRAIAAGRCRSDLDEEQVLLLIDMMGSCLRGRDEGERVRLARRSVDLLLSAIGIEPARGHE